MTDEQTNAQTHDTPTHNVSHVFACLSCYFHGNHFGRECVVYSSSKHNQSTDKDPQQKTQHNMISAFEEGIDFGVEEQMGENTKKTYYNTKGENSS
eukprot:6461625-Amphidinium_carterae.1